MEWVEICGGDDAVQEFYGIVDSFSSLLATISSFHGTRIAFVWDEYQYFLREFMDLSETLGFTWEQIEGNYRSKAESNKRRNEVKA
jgi:dimeric dUTPase (all-alpha-NTP-PPase superfamily)